MLDIILAILSCAVGVGTAYLGLHLTMHAPKTDTHRLAYKAGFILCGLVSCGLVGLQTYRNSTGQKSLTQQISGLKSDLTDTKSQVTDARREQQTEIARREQAEKDLKEIVQGSGMSTRKGVIEDIKKSPIKVDISGGSPEEALRLSANSIGVIPAYNEDNHVNQGTFALTTNKIVTPVRMLVSCEGDIDIASATIAGTNTVSSGGWGGKFSTKQYGVGINSPAWSPSTPLLVTVYASQNPGRCSFQEQ
jgi:hypothetical protein